MVARRDRFRGDQRVTAGQGGSSPQASRGPDYIHEGRKRNATMCFRVGQEAPVAGPGRPRWWRLPGVWRVAGLGVAVLLTVAVAVLEMWEHPLGWLRLPRSLVVSVLHWARAHWLTSAAVGIIVPVLLYVLQRRAERNRIRAEQQQQGDHRPYGGGATPDGGAGCAGRVADQALLGWTRPRGGCPGSARLEIPSPPWRAPGRCASRLAPRGGRIASAAQRARGVGPVWWTPRSANCRNASSRRCSPWQAANGEWSSGNPLTSPTSPGTWSSPAARKPSAAASRSTQRSRQPERQVTRTWWRAWLRTWWTTPCVTTPPEAGSRPQRPQPQEGQASR
jgi:hypothetical protein